MTYYCVSFQTVVVYIRKYIILNLLLCLAFCEVLFSLDEILNTGGLNWPVQEVLCKTESSLKTGSGWALISTIFPKPRRKFWYTAAVNKCEKPLEKKPFLQRKKKFCKVNILEYFSPFSFWHSH